VSNVRQCKWRKCKNAKLIQGHTSTKNAQLQANVAVSGNNPSDTPAKCKSKHEIHQDFASAALASLALEKQRRAKTRIMRL